MKRDVEEFSKPFNELHETILDEITSFADEYFEVSGLKEKYQCGPFNIRDVVIEEDEISAVAYESGYQNADEEHYLSFPTEYLWTSWIEQEKIKQAEEVTRKKERRAAVAAAAAKKQLEKTEAEERVMLAKLKDKYE
jgi:hypothetical protein